MSKCGHTHLTQKMGGMICSNCRTIVTEHDLPACCPDDEHLLDDAFNVGGGVVMLGCTKCPYWEPYDSSNAMEVTVHYLDEDGNIIDER